MPAHVTEISNTQFSRLRGLYKASARKRWSQIIVEGPQALRELVAHKPGEIRDIYVSEQVAQVHEGLIREARSRKVYCHICPAQQLFELSVASQGILAVARMPEAATLADLGDEPRLLFYTAGIQDPGNLGTIIRAADAAGADGVILGPGTVDAYSPKVIRSGAGSHFHIPLIAVPLDTVYTWAHQLGIQVLAADGHGEWEMQALVQSTWESELLGTPAGTIDLRQPTLWLLGNEAHGFTQENLDRADATVALPLYGKAESLNVSLAAGILSYLSALSQRAS